MNIFGKSEILTDLAKKYNPNIDYVQFCRMEEFRGLAQRSSNHKEKYRILIDRNRLPCIIMLSFVFFHEVGHIVLGHLEYVYQAKNCSKNEREAEADSWALKELCITDSHGKINEGCRTCYEHITGKSWGCGKY